MGLIDRLQRDIKQITTDAGGFAVPVIFSVTNGITVTSKTINAIAIKHHQAIDEMGRIVNSKTARISTSALALADAEFPFRDTNNKINLLKSTVTWTDISGVQATYQVTQQYPNEQTGSIVLILGDYGTVTPPGRIIIGWLPCAITANLVAALTDPLPMQLLDNGDSIPSQYLLNDDLTLTIPYMAGYGFLTPFMINNGRIEDEVYIKATGTFDNTKYGKFRVNTKVVFNGVVPIWQA